MSVLLAFFKEIGRQTFKRELQLNDPNQVWQRNALTVEDYSWGDIEHLGIISGFRCPTYRHTFVTLQRVSEVFPESKMLIVCKEEYKRDMEQQGVTIPDNWNVCSNVDELEQEMNVTFTPAQRRRFEQRFLPRFMNFVPIGQVPATHVVRRRRRVIIQGSGPIMSVLRAVMLLPPQEEQGVEEALQRSLDDYRMEEQVPIRERKRRKHPWDDILCDPVPLEDDAVDGIGCVVCMENYSTIQFVDAAGKCDHVVMCDDCAKIIMDDTKKCPTCRAEALTIRRNTKHLKNVI